MRTVCDATFRAEAERFRLRFTCDDCALFDSERDRCAHGFPIDEHRPAKDAEYIVFCKEFALR
ncbi:MAG: hypothetical protein R3A78_11565 [Polyangiales bacterium]